MERPAPVRLFVGHHTERAEPTYRSRPWLVSLSMGPIHLGLDVHRDTIAGTRFRIRRRIRADHPADPGTPIRYLASTVILVPGVAQR